MAFDGGRGRTGSDEVVVVVVERFGVLFFVLVLLVVRTSSSIVASILNVVSRSKRRRPSPKSRRSSSSRSSSSESQGSTSPLPFVRDLHAPLHVLSPSQPCDRWPRTRRSNSTSTHHPRRRSRSSHRSRLRPDLGEPRRVVRQMLDWRREEAVVGGRGATEDSWGGR